MAVGYAQLQIALEEAQTISKTNALDFMVQYTQYCMAQKGGVDETIQQWIKRGTQVGSLEKEFPDWREQMEGIQTLDRESLRTGFEELLMQTNNARAEGDDARAAALEFISEYTQHCMAQLAQSASIDHSPIRQELPYEPRDHIVEHALGSVEVQEENGTWRPVEISHKKCFGRAGAVVLSFGGGEYEGLAGDYNVASGRCGETILDGDGDEIQLRLRVVRADGGIIADALPSPNFIGYSPAAGGAERYTCRCCQKVIEPMSVCWGRTVLFCHLECIPAASLRSVCINSHLSSLAVQGFFSLEASDGRTVRSFAQRKLGNQWCGGGGSGSSDGSSDDQASSTRHASPPPMSSAAGTYGRTLEVLQRSSDVLARMRAAQEARNRNRERFNSGGGGGGGGGGSSSSALPASSVTTASASPGPAPFAVEYARRQSRCRGCRSSIHPRSIRWQRTRGAFYHLGCLPSAGGIDATTVKGWAALKAPDKKRVREFVQSAPSGPAQALRTSYSAPVSSVSRAREAREAAARRRQELIQRIRMLMQRELDSGDYNALLGSGGSAAAASTGAGTRSSTDAAGNSYYGAHDSRGVMHGGGVLKFAQGDLSSFQGEFVDGCMHGTG
jgi:hypothetical protein